MLQNQLEKKNNEIDFGTQVVASYFHCEDTHKIGTFFKTLASKKAAKWHLK